MQLDRSEYHPLLSSFKVSSFFCQDTYIVPALKCINFAVLIGIFVRCGVPLALRELAPRDQHCHIALRHFYLKAAP